MQLLLLPIIITIRYYFYSSKRADKPQDNWAKCNLKIAAQDHSHHYFLCSLFIKSAVNFFLEQGILFFLLSTFIFFPFLKIQTFHSRVTYIQEMHRFREHFSMNFHKPNTRATSTLEISSRPLLVTIQTRLTSPLTSTTIDLFVSFWALC